MFSKNFQRKYALTDQGLRNVREIRAANQEARYLEGLNQKIDEHETVTIRGELGTGIFVNAASVIMRLGVATTILVGADLILSGQIDFMLLFLFLLVITRVYAPFDQSLALIAEMFVSQVSADRINEIYDTPAARGRIPSSPRATTLCLNMWASPMTKEGAGRRQLHREGGRGDRPGGILRLRQKHLRPAGCPSVGDLGGNDPGGRRGHLHRGPGGAAHRLLHGVPGCGALRRHGDGEHPFGQAWRH